MIVDACDADRDKSSQGTWTSLGIEFPGLCLDRNQPKSLFDDH